MVEYKIITYNILLFQQINILHKMAKKKKEKSIEESLWASANKLRGTVEPSEYKQAENYKKYTKID